MTAYALISGALFKAPEAKTSRNGKSFATATVKTRSDDNKSEFWRLVAFNENVINELMRLGEGDTVSVQGPFKAELYHPEGSEPRVSMSIVADSVQPLRAAKKERTSKDTGNDKPIRRSPQAQAANGPNSDFRMRHHGGHSSNPALDDDIPF